MTIISTALLAVQSLGATHPLPMLGQTGFALDDMQAMPEIAVVQAIGAPRIENRMQRRLGTTSEITVVVQRFHVLASSPPLPATVEVVGAPWTQYPQYPQAVGTIKPLDSRRNYLLFGSPSESGNLAISQFMFSGPDGRRDDLMHYVSSTGKDELVGWALATTNAVTVSSGRSRAEQVLNSLVESLSAQSYDPDFDGATLLARLNRHTYRTIAKSAPNEVAASAKEDFVIPGITSDRYYQEELIPRLKIVASSSPEAERERIYDTLAKWKDTEGLALAQSKRIKP